MSRVVVKISDLSDFARSNSCSLRIISSVTSSLSLWRIFIFSKAFESSSAVVSTILSSARWLVLDVSLSCVK